MLLLPWWILKEQPFWLSKGRLRRAQLAFLPFHLVRTMGFTWVSWVPLKVRWTLDHLKMPCPRRKTVDSGRQVYGQGQGTGRG